MIIQHNMQSMNTKRQLGITTNSQTKSTDKLSSGYRINRASDDAAGLTISEKMRWQIRGLDKGNQNIQDGISVCQVMDGALAEVHEMTHRMKELAVQAANDTNTESDRAAIQKEINQLITEIDRTTGDTTFNTKQLLRHQEGVWEHSSGTGGKVDVVFILDNTGSMDSYINNVMNNLTGFATGLRNCDVQYGVYVYGDVSEDPGKSYPGTAYGFTSNVSDVVSTMRNMDHSHGGDGPESALEAVEASLAYPFRSDATKELILVTDADYHYKDHTSTCNHTGTCSDLTAAQIKNQVESSGANLSVVTSNSFMNKYRNTLTDGAVLNIAANFHDSLMKLATGISERAGEEYYKSPEDILIQHSSNVGDYSMIHTYDITSQTLEIADMSVLTGEDANIAITKADAASERISYIRSQIGAEQNGLEHAFALNGNNSENTTAAESRLRDTDIAKEMVEYSKNNVLIQAGQSVLAQANQSSQGVLPLLG